MAGVFFLYLILKTMKEITKKYITSGIWNFSDKELLSVVFDDGTAEKILTNNDHSLKKVMSLGVNELKRYRGIAETKALGFIAMKEIVKRSSAEYNNKQKINSSRSAFEILQGLGECQYEQFWILMLDRANYIISKAMISEGGISGTVVDPKKIFKVALDIGASAIILCHNHPSGIPVPSEADIKITKKLKDGGVMLEIAVLDHIIIGGESYYSCADEGAL